MLLLRLIILSATKMNFEQDYDVITVIIIILDIAMIVYLSMFV